VADEWNDISWEEWGLFLPKLPIEFSARPDLDRLLSIEFNYTPDAPSEEVVVEPTVEHRIIPYTLSLAEDSLLDVTPEQVAAFSRAVQRRIEWAQDRLLTRLNEAALPTLLTKHEQFYHERPDFGWYRWPYGAGTYAPGTLINFGAYGLGEGGWLESDVDHLRGEDREGPGAWDGAV
jgi:hypothetical protein